MSLEHTTTNPSDQLTAEASAWLADTMARNTARFGGWSMEADTGSTGDAGTDDSGDADDKGTDDADSQGSDDTDADKGTDADDKDADARKKFNKESQRYRQQARDAQAKADKAQAQLDAITKAISGDKGDDAPDPAVLAQQVEKATADLASTQRELAVFKAAAAANANAAALLDSRSFVDSLADVDASDGDAITAAIKDAVKKNPAYRLTQGSSAGGGDIDPGKREDAAGPSQEQFNKMTLRERAALKTKNPAAYKKLAG